VATWPIRPTKPRPSYPKQSPPPAPSPSRRHGLSPPTLLFLSLSLCSRTPARRQEPFPLPRRSRAKTPEPGHTPSPVSRASCLPSLHADRAKHADSTPTEPVLDTPAPDAPGTEVPPATEQRSRRPRPSHPHVTLDLPRLPRLRPAPLPRPTEPPHPATRTEAEPRHRATPAPCTRAEAEQSRPFLLR
jgi:hypothetical protein